MTGDPGDDPDPELTNTRRFFPCWTWRSVGPVGLGYVAERPTRGTPRERLVDKEILADTDLHRLARKVLRIEGAEGRPYA